MHHPGGQTTPLSAFLLTRFTPRWLLVVIALLVVALLGLGGLLLYTGTPPWVVMSLLTSDAEVELRQEMRPARGKGPRVLVLALGGVGAGEFRDAVRSVQSVGR